jgi:hypothetical protein
MTYAACYTQSPYSPDLALSDFSLFPTMKEELEQIQVADEDQFFESLQEILRNIDQKELHGVFQALVRRVQKANQSKVMETTSDDK